MNRKRRPLRDLAERFRETYGKPLTKAERAIEREVCGTSEGVRGYTTITQADDLAERLALRPGALLLDIGAGRGWPGLYLARKTGCRVALVDLPVAALRDGMDRARRQRVQDRCFFLSASGSHPPFRPRTFDAIVHTDVL